VRRRRVFFYFASLKERFSMQIICYMGGFDIFFRLQRYSVLFYGRARHKRVFSFCTSERAISNAKITCYTCGFENNSPAALHGDIPIF